MTAERWRHLESLFHQALECAPSEREALLDHACKSDPQLREEIDDLLVSHGGVSDLLGTAAGPLLSQLAGPARTSLQAGRHLGAYRILNALGAGGMGEVYAAVDTRLGRTVALKFLPPEASLFPQSTARLLREARIASTLNHPNIITIFETGEVDGLTFVASEFVPGETLRALISRGRLAASEALRISRQIASAITAAHAVGIIHRDIKPENVMLRPDGLVKLLDFGLAKASQLPGSVADYSRTLPGRQLGTPRYMSPEQVRGEELNGRTDVWSSGVVFYEMLVGHAPFTGKSALHVAVAILENTPAGIPGLPPDWASVIARSLEKDPTKRYADGREWEQALSGLSEKFPSRLPARPLLLTRRSAVASLAGTGMIAAGWWAWRQGIFAAEEPTLLVARVLATESGITDLAISPDGHQVAYIINEAGQQSILLRQVGASISVAKLSPTTVQYGSVMFSPDGTYLLYTVSDRGDIATLFRIPLVGGTPEALIRDVDSPVSFSPDGREFAFIRNLGNTGENVLLTALADGRGEREVTRRKAPQHFTSQGVVWLPEGSAIACGVNVATASGPRMQIARIDARMGTTTMMLPHQWGFIGRLAWDSRAGRLLACVTEPQEVSLQLVEITPGRKVSRQWTSGPGSYPTISVSRNSGVRLATRHDRPTGVYVQGKGGEVHVVAAPTGRYYYLSWTPDGRLLTVSARGGSQDLWELDPVTNQSRPLTRDVAMEWSPRATPNGKYIVYSSTRGQARNLWRLDRQTGQTRQLTDGPGPDLSLDLTPDGRTVIFDSWRSRRAALWRVSIEGGPAEQVAPDLADTPVVSPDGRLIACQFIQSQPAQGRSIALIPITGGNPVRIFPDIALNNPVRFTRDGKGLTYIRTKNGVSNLWNVPLAGGAPKQVTSFRDSYIYSFDWGKDGRLGIVRGTPIDDMVLFEAGENK